MNEQAIEILTRVAGETLEQLAFIFSFPEEERDTLEDDSLVATSVSFAGPFSGTLVMTISAQILQELTANMLGMDDEEEIALDQQHDALKETINVICGNLLPAIAGKKAVFDLDAPKIIDEAEAIKKAAKTNDGRAPTAIVRLDIDDEPCDLFLFGDIKIQEE